MLSVSKYTQEYVDSCRRLLDRQLAAYDDLVAGRIDAGASGFETEFSNNTLLVLDHLFVHRTRGQEGKDGNPLNEVRLLCESIMEHDAVMVDQTTIKLRPENTVLGYAPGDRIALTRADLGRLSDAYLDAISERFM